MSSWANRRVLTKRDISKIPEEFRPQIIPRVARPEVVVSESFQESLRNEIILNTTNSSKNTNNIIKTDINPRQYVTKKINTTLNPSAFELLYMTRDPNTGQFIQKTYVFVILRHLRNIRDNDLWISSYNSIRKFYTNKIVIIDDNSSINTVDGKLVNTEVIRSEFNGAGEILPYYYFLKYKWADTMIFLHDSMFIHRLISQDELEDNIKFHWHFEKDYTSDVSKVKKYLSHLDNGTELEEFVLNPTNKWYGCFGATSICDLDILQYLDNKYKLISNLVILIRTRKDREAFERILGIILYYEKRFDDDNKCSNFGDILKYPGAFDSENNNMETSAHIIGQKGYNTAIIKVWRGR
jgi:hypothetical protein